MRVTFKIDDSFSVDGVTTRHFKRYVSYDLPIHFAEEAIYRGVAYKAVSKLPERFSLGRPQNPQTFEDIGMRIESELLV